MPVMPAKKTPGDGVQISARLWDNPYVKGLVWFAGITFALVSSAISSATWVESRYAKTEEVQAVKNEVLAQASRADQANKKLQLQMEYQSDRNRKRSLEDQLFKFEMTPERQKTQTDRALSTKYKQEIQEMNDRWNKIGMPLK
jgi:hypothetical protein